MSKGTYAVLFLTVAAGAAAGWSGSKLIQGKQPSGAQSSKESPALSSELKPMPVFSRPLPLSANDPSSPEYFAEIAIWSAEASAEDVAKLWLANSDKYREGATVVNDLLLDRWVQLDPEGAVRALALHPIGSGPAWTAWAKHDPEKALAAAKVSGRKRSIEWVVKSIADKNPDLALKLIDEDPSIGGFVISSITARLAKEGKYQQSLDLKMRYGTTSVSQELKIWAKDDPHAAMRWCLARPFGDAKNRETVYETFLDQYPDSANELLAILPDAKTRLEFAEKRMTRLLEKSPQEAIDFVKSQPNPESRDKLSISLGKQLVKSDWALAADIVKDLAANNVPLAYRSTCVEINETDHMSVSLNPPAADLIRDLAGKNPKGTFELASKIAEEKDQPGLLNAVQNTWIFADRFGFSEYLAAQPPSPQRDKWTEELVYSLTSHSNPARNDYPSSIEWSLSIQNAEKKTEALCGAAMKWKEGDPAGLEAFLSDKNIPAVNRDAVRKAVETPTDFLQGE